MNLPFRGSAWGSQSIELILPFGNLQINSISASQGASLSAAYSQFLDDSSSDQINSCIELQCNVYELDTPLTIPASQYSINGQYAPRQEKECGSIILTGYNFKATINPKSYSAPCVLGVADESDLANPVVIENFLRILAAYRATEQRGVLLHSAGVVIDNKSYILCGQSNAGKTTFTKKAYHSGATVLSDDLNFLLPETLGYSAHAVPFTGEFGRTLSHAKSQQSYPVKVIAFLEKGEKLEVSEISSSRAIAKLITNCPFVNSNDMEFDRLFEILKSLVEKVPIVRLRSRKDDCCEDIIAEIDRVVENA